jgi:hypothetical protein
MARPDPRRAVFGAAWRKHHPRRRIPIPDELIRKLALIASDMERAGFRSWEVAMWELQLALRLPDPDTEYQLRWPVRHRKPVI